MNYQELRDYALQSSLEHHLCNVDELLQQGSSLEEIMAMVSESDNTYREHNNVVVYEPFEYYEADPLVNAIEDLRGVNFYNFMHVLTEVNGQEWATNFKAGE